MGDKCFGVFQFSGKNFDSWSFRVKSILKKDGVLYTITEDPPVFESREARTKWDKDNALAEAIIIGCVAESHLQYLKDQDSARLMWKNISDAFSKQNFCSEAMLRRKLQRLRCEESSTLDDYFVKFDDLVCQLNAIDVKMNDREKVRYLFDGLPESYDPLVTALENLKDEELKVSIVKNRLLAEELKKFERKNGGQSNVGTALAAGGNKSFNNKKSNEKPKSKKKFKGKCFKCGKVGHKEDVCRSGQSESHYANSSETKDVPVAFMTRNGGSAVDGAVWILDSGASEHQTNAEINLNKAFELKPPIQINVAKEGQAMVALKSGTICAVSKAGENETKIVLKNVLYIPELRRNLLSIRRMAENGIEVKFTENKANIIHDGKIIGVAVARGGLYEWRMQRYERGSTYLTDYNKDDLLLWHRRMGHLNFRTLTMLSQKRMVKGKQSRDAFDGHRPATKRPLERVHSDVCYLDVTSWDGNRYFVLFIDDYSHFVVIYFLKNKNEVFSAFKEYEAMATAHFGQNISKFRIDNGTEYLSEAQKNYYRNRGIQIETSIPHSPQQNGVSERFNRTLLDKARTMISDSKLPKYMWSEALRVAAFVTNRSPTTAIPDGKTPFELWNGYKPDVSRLRIFGSRCYVWIPSEKRGKMDPKSKQVIMVGYSPSGYRLWDASKRKVIEGRDVKFLEDFGSSNALPSDSKEVNTNKSSSSKQQGERNNTGKLSSNHDKEKELTPFIPWSIFKTNETVLDAEGAASGEGDFNITLPSESSRVTSTPLDIPRHTGAERLHTGKFLNLSNESSLIRDLSYQDNVSLHSGAHDDEAGEAGGCQMTVALPSESSRVTSTPLDIPMHTDVERLVTGKFDHDPFVSLSYIHNMYLHVPNKYNDIEMLPNAKEWKNAVEEEKLSLMENKTWESIAKPKGVKMIDSKWVFTLKTDEHGQPLKYKARLVARGFMQKPGIDYEETYSPVAKLATIRIFLAICLQKSFFIEQLDVKTAFLNGNLKEDVYLKIPEGFQAPEGHIFKLNKSLYGLKQSPRCWNQRFNEFVETLGFVRSKSDACLYVLRINEHEMIYLLLYVDDILIAAANMKTLRFIINHLKNEFKMKEMGVVNNFLNIQIKYDRENGIMELSQKAAIKKLLEKFNMINCRSSKTPMEPNLVLQPTTKRKKFDYPYREVIGSIMYIMLSTRPDVCFAISYLSRFQDKFDEQHWNHLKQLLKYLKGTLDFSLIFKRSNGNPIVGYVDADFARDTVDRKSTSGFLYEIYGCTILWCSKKQPIVTRSTTEAEYVAASFAVCEGLWIKQILQDLCIAIHGPITIYEDNQSCIKTAENQESKLSKHIDVKYHHIREKVNQGLIKLLYLQSNEQKADMMTKPLTSVQFIKFRGQIGIQERGC